MSFALGDDPVLPAEPFRLPDGPVLAVRRAHGPLRPFLLVHDAGRDSRDWNQVGARLAAAGHEVAAADLRGHGASEAPGSGYDTDTCADDLAALIELLGFTGGRSAIVAGDGWGATVAASLAARRDGVAALACFDGGWTRPAWRFPDVAAYLGSLALPATGREVAAAAHTSIFRGEPRAWFGLIRVPVLLGPVVPPEGTPDPDGSTAATRTGVAEVAAGLARSRTTWYPRGTARLPLDQPGRVTDDLLDLAVNAEPAVAGH